MTHPISRAEDARRVAEAEVQVRTWAERWGERFTVGLARSTPACAMIVLPDGSQVHRHRLLWLRRHGLLAFGDLRPGAVLAVG